MQNPKKAIESFTQRLHSNSGGVSAPRRELWVVKKQKPDLQLSRCVCIDAYDMIEDFLLLAEADERMKSSGLSQFTGHKDIMKELEIDPAELDDIDVEIE